MITLRFPDGSPVTPELQELVDPTHLARLATLEGASTVVTFPANEQTLGFIEDIIRPFTRAELDFLNQELQTLDPSEPTQRLLAALGVTRVWQFYEKPFAEIRTVLDGLQMSDADHALALGDPLSRIGSRGLTADRRADIQKVRHLLVT